MDPWNNSATRTRNTRGEWKTYSNPSAINMEEFIASDENNDKTGYIENKSFKTRLQEFGDCTTLHGARYLTNTKYHGLRRSLWVAIVLVLLGYLIYNIYQNILRYIQYPIHSIVGVEYATSAVFPAVTLCNYNQFRKSALNDESIPFVKQLNAIQVGDFGNFNEVNWTYIGNYQTINGRYEESDFRSMSHQISDMLDKCLWRSSPCGVDNFTQVITDWGVCYTFNGDISNALRVSQAGNKNGLSLRINIEQFEYVTGEDEAAGIKVLLHPQGEAPLVRQLGFSVSPGFETSVSVRYTEATSLPYPWPSNCKVTDDGTDYSSLYTIHNCHYECQIEYVVQECGCRDYRYPGNATLCAPRQLFDCVYAKEDQFSAENLAAECKCPIPCDCGHYDGKISTAYLPGQHISDELKRRQNRSEEYIRKNYLNLKIFFETMTMDKVKEVEAYPFETMLSDIGGSMGLLAGMSLVTIAEFIDFFIASCCKKYNQSRRKTLAT